jgi:hypothetical protein
MSNCQLGFRALPASSLFPSPGVTCCFETTGNFNVTDQSTVTCVPLQEALHQQLQCPVLCRGGPSHVLPSRPAKESGCHFIPVSYWLFWPPVRYVNQWVTH